MSAIIPKHCGTHTITTNRLVLRRFTPKDAKYMIKYWISDPEVQLLYGEPVYLNKKDVNLLIDKWLEFYELPHFYRWCITIKGVDRSIGQIALYNVDLHNHWCEIEYCLSREYQSMGYVTEALKAVLNFGFNTVNFNRMQISHRSKNKASERVINKCAFQFEGIWRNALFFDGEYDDRLYYSILHDDFVNRQSSL